MQDSFFSYQPEGSNRDFLSVENVDRLIGNYQPGIDEIFSKPKSLK